MERAEFRLTHRSVDDDEEASDHPTLAAAIGAAEAWFRDGYTDNETLSDVDIEEDVARLREDLAAGRSYHCGKFHEVISITRAAEA